MYDHLVPICSVAVHRLINEFIRFYSRQINDISFGRKLGTLLLSRNLAGKAKPGEVAISFPNYYKIIQKHALFDNSLSVGKCTKLQILLSPTTYAMMSF